MKEIKAYVRTNNVQDVVSALEQHGFRSMTIIDVSGLGSLIDPIEYKYSTEFVEKYSKVVRIELVCKDGDAARVVQIMKEHARTGYPGDGIIFVLPVERSVKIRTGEEGERILQP